MRINDAIWDELEAENRTLKTRIAELELEQTLHDAELDAGTARAERAEAAWDEWEASFNEKCAQCGRLQERIGSYINEKLSLERRAREAEAALAEANAKYRSAVECSQDERDRAITAEAALAERERMLRLAVGDAWVSNGWNRVDAEEDPGFAGEIDALRARAEEGSGDE